MKKLLTLLLILSSNVLFAQNFYLLRGYIVNQDAEPLMGAIIRIENTGQGAVSNEDGQYEIRLEEGLHRLHYSIIGHTSVKLEHVLNKNDALNVTLESADEQLGTVKVIAKRKDFSYEIIKKVIANEKKYKQQFTTQKRNIYVKSVEEYIKTKAAKPKKKEDVDPFKNDSIPDLNLFEATFTQHSKPPFGIKEEKLAAKKIGSQRTLFLTNTTESNFNFYKNLITDKKLGDNSYVSPLHPSGVLSYRFKLLGSRFENGQKVYTIKVIPRKMGNALFEGIIEVWDEVYALKSINLKVNKGSLIIYNSFRIKQEYFFQNKKWLLANQEFRWKIKNAQQTTKGNCIVKYSEYKFDSTYSKRFFNAEVGTTKEDAYEKDTSFWTAIRPVPLSKDEREFIAYNDSIERIKNSSEYLDSIDAVFNKITPLKLLWEGFGKINRAKKQTWDFDPAISLLDPVAIGGWRVKYAVQYFKKFENRKSMRIIPRVHYGFKNNDLRGNLYFRYTYNPIKRSSVRLNTGRYFGFINQFATINDIVNRANFFNQTHLNLNHRTELFNGFYFSTTANYLYRSDLGDFKFGSIGDNMFENNVPQTFESHSAMEGLIGVSYTPKQLYIMEPKEKVVLGSKFPTFSLRYRQGLQGVFNSQTKFKHGEFAIDQVFNIGVMGTSQYNVRFGGFLDTSSLKIMDYKYQRGGDAWIFLPPTFGYQQIDSSFAVFKPYFESHYVHQFNGSLSSKIPGIKQMGIKIMAGGGALWVPERNYQYAELFGGVNRVFKLGKERIRLGVYYVISEATNQGFRNGIKFSFEPYNQSKNTWSF